jgi:N-acetylmuramoyl-L-alanine amidase
LAAGLFIAGCSPKPQINETTTAPVTREWQGRNYYSATHFFDAAPVLVENETQLFFELFTGGVHWRWQAGSKRMWVNGILVWLDFVAFNEDAVLYISEHDLVFAITPLREIIQQGEPRIQALVSRPRIVIDPGHGGHDPGAVNKAFGLEEKTLTLKTAKQLAETLRILGWDVVLTREKDVFLALSERPQIANQVNADIFVSIHYNAASNLTAEGIEVFVLSTPATDESDAASPLTGHAHLADSLRLGWRLQSALIRETKALDRGVRRNRFAVLRDCDMPGVLVELGFMSHEETARKLSQAQTINDLANALAIGLENYFGGF